MMLKQTCFCNGRKIYRHLGPLKDEQEQATTALLQPHPFKVLPFFNITLALNFICNFLIWSNFLKLNL